MSVLKNILSLWFLIGACYAYSLRDIWVPRIREARWFGRATIMLILVFICMVVAPVAEAFFFLGEHIKFKEK